MSAWDIDVEDAEGQVQPSAYGGRALTNGNPGGNEPTGNLAERSPDLSSSAASRNAPRKR
jgi:hypothetical protein